MKSNFSILNFPLLCRNHLTFFRNRANLCPSDDCSCLKNDEFRRLSESDDVVYSWFGFYHVYGCDFDLIFILTLVLNISIWGNSYSHVWSMDCLWSLQFHCTAHFNQHPMETFASNWLPRRILYLRARLGGKRSW